MEWKEHIDALVAKAQTELNLNGRRETSTLCSFDDFLYWLRRFFLGTPNRMPASTTTQRRRLLARTIRSLQEPMKSMAHQARDRMLDWVAYAKLRVASAVEDVEMSWKSVLDGMEPLIISQTITPDDLQELQQLITLFDTTADQEVEATAESITSDFAIKASMTGPLRRPLEELHQAAVVATRKNMQATFFESTQKLRQLLKHAEKEPSLAIEELVALRNSHPFNAIHTDLNKIWTSAAKELHQSFVEKILLGDVFDDIKAVAADVMRETLNYVPRLRIGTCKCRCGMRSIYFL
ncbi:hypothetical protein DFQ28_005879 [Apophysomyces sp. BC1034]|nr:hypothetical protein DFQ29_007546 [Apophysomyces sp. BC1021]KAG0193261.1 hypothetical protein DFQ28_005879 [Apophysomyces sp. BC1034]